MKNITLHTFKHTIRDIHANTENRKFCFVIGAGASYKSGIPTGGQLAQKWFNEIKERYSNEEFKQWIKEVKLNKKDIAAHYGSIYRKRFESDKASGYEFLVQEMRDAKPTFGHIVLAQILTKYSGNCILTTNFDSLIESSIYQYTDKTPLVCGHESLSGYARPSSIHPLIIKIHRDLLLAPKSDIDEINTLDEGWKEPLNNIFSNHIPIVIGYGGNDGSLMAYFEKMNKPSNFFWCGLKGAPISNRVVNLVEQMDGNYIEIDGFDEMMLELLWVFDKIKPIKEELDNITKSRIEAMNSQFNTINIQSEKVNEVKTTPKKELSALEYSNLAKSEPNFEKRKVIYLEALAKFPNTGWLWSDFTYFLHYIKKDFEYLNEYYIKALMIDPKEPSNNGNYANFLTSEKQSSDAEMYYLAALASEPENEIYNGNYASFLKDIKGDYDKAEKFYIKALDINPNNSVNLLNYALFLKNCKQDYDNANRYYLRALNNDPENIIPNSSYANFLFTIKNDAISAERYYIKSLSISPKDPLMNGNYAQILFIINRTDEALACLEKAFLYNKDEKNSLLIELWFYKYAHHLESLTESEEAIELLLKQGVQSIGWSFDKNVEVAIKNGHPNPQKLKEFAKRITTRQN